uniref:Uncharacterized protein n=1 Tax=Rangifer tarandus platyrhynchus TaxID=3082113 RepID=A0ACB0DXZ9_RANTA|nr:unnamed protein product [Rangifer tarandus platyrhynchus]
MGLFLVTVWVHILLPGICTQTFPRIDCPYPTPTSIESFKKTNKTGVSALYPPNCLSLGGVLASVRSAQGEGSGCTDHPNPFSPPKRALGPGKRIASPGRSSPSGLLQAGARLPSTGLLTLKRRREPPSRLRRDPPKGRGAGAPGARRSGPQGRCPLSRDGKAQTRRGWQIRIGRPRLEFGVGGLGPISGGFPSDHSASPRRRPGRVRRVATKRPGTALRTPTAAATGAQKLRFLLLS